LSEVEVAALDGDWSEFPPAQRPAFALARKLTYEPHRLADAIVARQDRAWYAVGEARGRLRGLGQSDQQIYKLDGDWADFPPAERALFQVARQLAAAPIVLTDADVAEALRAAGLRAVVQLISYTAGRAFFDRVTEAAGLQLER
jgi:alkylhydroperoxidase family enzyme